ncbi:MAG: mechanosensitive ion channel [Melioribacteraceae bacterium]|jgi:small conductance mechanosensitive channel|nr:mechanosensitive ion channel [Melioribacteraceae bacterium]
MQEIFDILKNWAEVYILKIIAAIAILVIGKIIAGMIRNFVKKLLNKSNMDLTIVSFLSNLLYGLLITLIVLVALGQLGVETTSFVAIVGAAGLAVGFALKDSLGNFASGVMLLINKPFSVGHYIEAGGTAGTVLEIKLFATKLKTPDNKVIYVPNASVVGGNITNFSAEDTRRVDMQFGIGYNDDIDKAKQIILKLLSNDDRVLKDPKPQVVVGSLGDSSVNIVVRPWVNKADYWGFFFDMTETVKKEFDNAGVSIPFPQRDVHLYQQSKN